MHKMTSPIWSSSYFDKSFIATYVDVINIFDIKLRPRVSYTLYLKVGYKDSGGELWNGGFFQFQKLDTTKWPQLRSFCALIITKWCQILLNITSELCGDLLQVDCHVKSHQRFKILIGLSKSRLFNFLQY